MSNLIVESSIKRLPSKNTGTFGILENELDAFQDIRRYRYFNTNNIWINLKALKTLFDERKIINLPLILNAKTLDPRDETSPPVYQVESAMGAAVSLFDGTAAVRVPRIRFYPVKTCNQNSDLN